MNRILKFAFKIEIFWGAEEKKAQFIQMNPIDPFLDFKFNTYLEKNN